MIGFTLTKRPCKIGPSINTRTEKHGDDDVTAMDIPLSGIILQPAELDAVMGHPHASLSIFTQPANGAQLAEPRFPMLAPLQLAEKFEQAAVLIVVGLKSHEIQLGGVRLAKVRLQPLAGGVTEMSVQVQCTPEIGPKIAQLFAHLNHSADVEISVGEVKESAKQGHLGLDPQHPGAAPA